MEPPSRWPSYGPTVYLEDGTDLIELWSQHRTIYKVTITVNRSENLKLTSHHCSHHGIIVKSLETKKEKLGTRRLSRKPVVTHRGGGVSTFRLKRASTQRYFFAINNVHYKGSVLKGRPEHSQLDFPSTTVAPSTKVYTERCQHKCFYITV